MKLSTLAVVAVTAGFAQVSAAPNPLRLIFISPDGSAPAAVPAPAEHLRFGHAVANANSVPSRVAQKLADFAPKHHQEVELKANPQRRPVRRPGCNNPNRKNRVARLRQMALETANKLRAAFGLPLIHTWDEHKVAVVPVHVENGFVSILPFPGPHHSHQPHAESHTPSTAWFVHPRPGHTGPHVHAHAAHRHYHGGSFMGRLHYSLLNLGPWEGRAVAFVLGCGIGVLLRMFWVLFVVGYRAMKGPSQDEIEYTGVAIIEYESESDDETVISASPPVYTDEKIPILVEEAK